MPTLREINSNVSVHCDFPPALPNIDEEYPFGGKGFKTGKVKEITKSDEEGFEFTTVDSKYRVIY